MARIRLNKASLMPPIWLRLCRSGGHIVLDDINWPSVGQAFAYLKATAKLTYEVSTDADGHFAIFSKH